MDKYECTACGYIYDPETGDEAYDLEAGVAFEDLPDDFVCPLCGLDKSAFVKVEE